MMTRPPSSAGRYSLVVREVTEGGAPVDRACLEFEIIPDEKPLTAR